MHKSLIPHKIALRIGFMITFLRDTGLTIKRNIVKVSNLHRAYIIIQVPILILQRAKYGVEPFLWLPLTRLAGRGPWPIIRVILYNYPRPLAIQFLEVFRRERIQADRHANPAHLSLKCLHTLQVSWSQIQDRFLTL